MLFSLYYLAQAAVAWPVTMFFYFAQKVLQYPNIFSVKYSPASILAVIMSKY